jgi:hypothetical protein
MRRQGFRQVRSGRHGRGARPSGSEAVGEQRGVPGWSSDGHGQRHLLRVDPLVGDPGVVGDAAADARRIVEGLAGRRYAPRPRRSAGNEDGEVVDDAVRGGSARRRG